jgi:hypothetical protein
MNLTLLACVEKVGVQGTTKNIFYLMFTTIVTFEGLKVEELRVKFLSKGYDVNNVFQDARANVTTNEGECGSISNGNTFFYSSNQPSCVDFIRTKFGCLIGGPPSSFIRVFFSFT